jgi:hypothetical protein
MDFDIGGALLCISELHRWGTGGGFVDDRSKHKHTQADPARPRTLFFESCGSPRPKVRHTASHDASYATSAERHVVLRPAPLYCFKL